MLACYHVQNSQDWFGNQRAQSVCLYKMQLSHVLLYHLTGQACVGQSGPGLVSMTHRGPSAAVTADHTALGTGPRQLQTGAQVKRSGQAAAL